MATYTLSDFMDELAQQDDTYFRFKEVKIEESEWIKAENCLKERTNFSRRNNRDLTSFMAYLLLCCEKADVPYEELKECLCIHEDNDDGAHYSYQGNIKHSIYLNDVDHRVDNIYALLELLYEKGANCEDENGKNCLDVIVTVNSRENP